MAVNVFIRSTGERFSGKFAAIKDGTVYLYAGITPDGKGGFHGSGKRLSFREAEVDVLAHRPDQEIVVVNQPPVSMKNQEVHKC